MRGFALVTLLLAVSAVVTSAQGIWEYEGVTPAEFETYNPQVALDRWGNTHLMWSSRDPKRSGLQLFYSHNGSGRFAAPIQVTDTGTVFDSTSLATSSFVFRLDSSGVVHVAFVANVENHLRLYYTNNATGHFEPGVFLAERTHFGMAVDSAGSAHVAWAEDGEHGINVLYWSSLAPEMTRNVGTIACNRFRYGCRVGDVEVESGPRGVVIALAADSSSIYHLQLPIGAPQRMQIPGYDFFETMQGRADLRFRLALDDDGNLHLLVPRVTPTGRHRLLYATNANGYFSNAILVDTLGHAPAGFDLVFNGTDRLAATWSVEPPAGEGRSGFAEIARSSKGWSAVAIERDLDRRLGSARPIWKRALRVAIAGERAVVAALARPEIGREEVVAVFSRSGMHPQLAYLHPDAAAPGMNVVVEAIAPVREKGSFGPDGFRGDSVSLQLRNFYDTSRVVIGPSVVSWTGRLVSTMLFVKPGAAPGPVPLEVRIGNARSNVDTFYIVAPQHIGDSAGVLAGGGVLGSGGRFGTRSRRGVLVVESLRLTDGVYTVDTNDVDPSVPGNQGFLPVTILSAGPVLIDSGAVLSVSALHDQQGRFGTGGPGGGGGGSGGWIDGGSGFTGGAGGGRNLNGPIGASIGSGPDVLSSRWGGGLSLNRVPGGVAFPEAPGGGGTGHPFGASGTFGRTSRIEPMHLDAGGVGGASAGSQATAFDAPTTGGGGGGHGRAGLSGNEHNEISNGGIAVGSRPLVPLAGGSGGGGGGFSTHGVASGGGGGGALGLFGYGDVEIAGRIEADGAAGIGDIAITNSSGGGGGAGGGIIIGAKGTIRFLSDATVSAQGGQGGRGNATGAHDGGRGGDGRIRIDGRAGGGAATRTLPSAAYTGPATGTNGSFVARDGSMIRGTGEPGRTIQVFMRTDNTPWNFRAAVTTIVGADSTWQLKLDAGTAAGKVYLVAMQRIDNPSRGGFDAEPAWVMSAAGGNIVGQPSMSLSTGGHRFDCIKYGESDSALVYLRNTSILSDIVIRDIRIDGADRLLFGSSYVGERIEPGDSMAIVVRFAPRDTGTFRATVAITTNIQPDSVATIALEGCAVAGELRTSRSSFELGTRCVGDTIRTSITLYNVGDAALTIARIRGDGDAVDVTPDVALPIVLRHWGDSATVGLTIVVRRFDAAGLRALIETDGALRTQTLPIDVRDGRPLPVHTRSVVFRARNLSSKDTCERRSIWIANASDTDQLTITGAAVAGDGAITLVAPLAGRRIAPLDSIEAIVGFCTDVAGDYRGTLRLTFGEGMCARGDSIVLSGRATEGEDSLEILSDDFAIQFEQTLIDTEARPDSILVKNWGTVAAVLKEPVIESLDGTFDGEFMIVSPGAFPLVIGANETVRFGVRFAPRTVGHKEASVRFTSEDESWTSSVHLLGDGIVQGIALNYSTIDFRNVRLGSRSEPDTIRIYNNGTAADVVTGITPLGRAPFNLVAVEPLPPASVGPGDTIFAIFQYEPAAEVDDELVLSIGVASRAEPITVTLRGRGVLEHVAYVDSVDFGEQRRNAYVAMPDGFRVSNSGTHALVLHSAVFEQSGDIFGWVGAPPRFPDTVAPGAARSYSVRYRAETASDGSILFTTSAPEAPVRIFLRGRIQAEPDTADLWLPPYASGRVGDHVSVPIVAAFGSKPSQGARYSVTMRWASGLLALRGAAMGSFVPQSLLAGTMTSSAKWDSVAPGILRITGTLRDDAQSGVLFSIPMLVLSGPPAITALTFEAASVVATPGFVVRTLPGTFVGIDCDTGRGVVVKGRYELTQNAPNPFNPSSVIRYSVAAREHVRINLYDPSGFYLKALVDGVHDPGTYQLVVDASSIGSGVFTYEMISGPFREVRRMVVLE